MQVWFELNGDCLDEMAAFGGWEEDATLEGFVKRMNSGDCPEPLLHRTSRNTFPFGQTPATEQNETLGGFSRDVRTPGGETFCDPHGEEAIDLAFGTLWQIFQDNMDLVRWVGCVLREDLGDCLADRLTDRETTLTIALVDDVESPTGRNPPCDLTLKSSSDAGFCHRAPEIFSPDEDPGNAACGYAIYMNLIFHELIHCCTQLEHGRSPADNCSMFNIAQNTLLWALAQRHPSIRAGFDDCHAFANLPRFFGDGPTA